MLGCINQSFCLPVRFVDVASPPVQCSKTGLKKRDMKCWVVAMCARSYSPVPLFLCLRTRKQIAHFLGYAFVASGNCGSHSWGCNRFQQYKSQSASCHPGSISRPKHWIEKTLGDGRQLFRITILRDTRSSCCKQSLRCRSKISVLF